MMVDSSVLLAGLREFGQRENLLEVIVAELLERSSKVLISGGSIMSQKSAALVERSSSSSVPQIA
ncbi:hypothetical protein SAMN05216330_11410 [Bradyrhizobium sp. Ghvi]|uniref:hypothetical protein n=1 Tax=Bradyrhizobium sp. Ghvi TaxID=1855319 RepID=UPI0008E86C9B|nr:hypothetical protein [Bradyrhizobium sp. Ghvi]SFQ03894.1 hypothetical protein SAMN05216330_11410 [Bradyrhizobium sp. Ghvi]